MCTKGKEVSLLAKRLERPGTSGGTWRRARRGDRRALGQAGRTATCEVSECTSTSGSPTETLSSLIVYAPSRIATHGGLSDGTAAAERAIASETESDSLANIKYKVLSIKYID